MDEMIPHDPVNHPAHYTTGEREPERYRFFRDSMSDCFCDLDVMKTGDLVTFADYDALRADLARVTAERDEVVEACRGTQMDEAAIASMWSYVREKISIHAERDALRVECEWLRECINKESARTADVTPQMVLAGARAMYEGQDQLLGNWDAPGRNKEGDRAHYLNLAKRCLLAARDAEGFIAASTPSPETT